MMWHGKCYKLRIEDSFPIAELKDDENLDDPREKEKFRFGRNGDHLSCPFQCDICHFRNIQGRDPVLGSIPDRRLLVGIRRANIDAFWGRSAQTISGNRGDVKQLVRIGQEYLGMQDFLPPMGPHPLEDNWGMGLACCLLYKTLEPGHYGPNVQFHTARKLRSGFSNVWGASIHALQTGVMARDVIKIFVTKCPSYSLWFERFVRGMHARMGDDHRPDAAVSNKVMHALMRRVDVDYYEADDGEARSFIIRCGLYFMAGYLGSLRGEEIPRIIVRKQFLVLNKESLETEPPHCVLPLYGRFKTDRGIPRCYLFRISCLSKSGLNMERWVRRALESEEKFNTKYLFSNIQGKKDTGSIYEPYFYSKLKSIQREEKGLIPKSLDVEDAFGISRSLRRGSVTAAENAPNNECNDADIRRNNRWRMEDRAGTRKAGLDMLQLYTDTLHSVEADLKFSKCL